MKATIIVVMAIYFVAMVGISWLGKKHATNFDDYLSAGKSAGIALIIGGAMGAHIGNGLVVGGAGEGASVGLSGITYGLGCALSYIVLAFLMNDFVYDRGYMSLADYMRDRYHNEIPAQIFNIATTLSYVGLVGGQLMAGKALFEALGLSGTVGVFIIAIVVFLYSQISGLWGAFATSVVQTLVIAAGVLSAMIYIAVTGGFAEIGAAVASGAVPATFTKFYGGYDLSTVLILAIPTSLSIFTDQATFMRIGSAKSKQVSKVAHILSALLMIPLCLAPVVVGMYGAVKFGASGNSAFFTVILNCLPPFVAALIVTAVVAAVMSTIDSAFIAFSQVLIKDLYHKHINPQADEKALSKMTLGLNLVVAGVGIAFALTAGSLVDLLANVYLFLCAASLVPFLAGRLWKGGTAAGSIASSIVGCAFALMEIAGIYSLPYSGITLFIPALIAYVVVSLATGKKEA